VSKWMSPWRVAFVQLFVLGLFVLTVGARPVISDSTLYVDIGNSIARTGAIAHDGASTAFVTPGYPLFVAGPLKLGGPDAIWLIRLLQAAMLVASGLMLRWIAQAAGPSTRVGLGVQLLCTIYPPFLIAAGSVMTETLFSFLVVSCTWIYLFSLRRPAGPDASSFSILAGAFAASMALVAVRPTGVLLVGAVALVELARWARDRGALSHLPAFIAVAMVLGTVAFVGVWGTRNALVLGRFIPFSTEGSYVAYEGNLLEANGEGAHEEPYAASVDEATRARIEAGSEVERMDEFSTLLKFEFTTRRTEILALWLRKPPRFWLNVGYTNPPSVMSLAVAAFNATVLVLAAGGLWLLLRSRTAFCRVTAQVFVLFSVLLMSAHVATYASLRYAYPALMMLFVPAGMFLQTVVSRVRGGSDRVGEGAVRRA